MAACAMSSPSDLLARYSGIRERTWALCAPLAPEDHLPQPVTEVSPPKWHLGHTSWFFEAMLLVPQRSGYRAFDARWAPLFNSYYESQGARVERGAHGHLSRPTLAQLQAHRAHVDAAMSDWLTSGQTLGAAVLALLELGLQHEQQHQELLLTDLKYILGSQPLAPAYGDTRPGVPLPIALSAEHAPQPPGQGGQATSDWQAHAGGVLEIGHAPGPDAGFAFDNETPRHALLLAPFALRRQLVTNAEYLAFMADGGYADFRHWHAEGWDWVQQLPQRAPLYWRRTPDAALGWRHYTLQGERALAPEAPVSHVSFYEASAFCHWAGWRLPLEAEWEALSPQLDWGARWEWTASAYSPYPGFAPLAGAATEYNGKFMLSQMVLRGASFATSPGHARRTYRNFFHPPLRWQYTGIRPARGA